MKKKKLTKKDIYKIIKFFIPYTGVLISCIVGGEFGATALSASIVMLIAVFIIEAFDVANDNKRIIMSYPDHYAGWETKIVPCLYKYIKDKSLYDLPEAPCPVCEDGGVMHIYYVRNEEKEIGETHHRCKKCGYDVFSGHTWRLYYSKYEMKKMFPRKADELLPMVVKTIPQNEDPYNQPYRMTERSRCAC